MDALVPVDTTAVLYERIARLRAGDTAPVDELLERAVDALESIAKSQAKLVEIAAANAAMASIITRDLDPDTVRRNGFEDWRENVSGEGYEVKRGDDWSSATPGEEQQIADMIQRRTRRRH